MTTTTRAAALGVFAALILAIGSPQDAAAHAGGLEAHAVENLKIVVSQGSISGKWESPNWNDPGEPGSAAPSSYCRDSHHGRGAVRVIVMNAGRRVGVSRSPIDPHCNTNHPFRDGGVSNLPPGTTYTFIVQSLDGDGNVIGERHATATMPPAPPPPPHTHPYAPVAHSHSDLKHAHPFASSSHVHNTHAHPFAADDHTHDGTGSTPAASQPAASTCPRFIEIVSPWTYTRGAARELVSGSVLLAVDAIEYIRERTAPIVESARNGSDEVEGIEIRLKEAHAARDGSAGRGRDEPRSFILDGATFADMAASVRCRAAPVAVTTEDPPTTE